jgi:nicotinate phosphoribosyltransferase
MSTATPGAALYTDLYQVTMVAGYHAGGLAPPATFELYVRGLPPNRSFLVAAGLEQALEYLEQLHVTRDDIAYLREVPALRGAPATFFDDYLPRLRFTGDVWAVAEGTPVFPPEPLLRVTAPLPEGQLVETALLALIAFQTSVASRAARMVEAAAGRSVAEFGTRRAHGLEAGVLAGRAAFVAGCDSTSNVEAGRRYEIPVSGTMAHAWVMAFPDELSAFRGYCELFGDRAVLLLDTYDTIAAANLIVANELKPRAVRLDSGDLVALSRQVRELFDRNGLRDTAILASGDLDERRIAAIVTARAPIDGFGVGAALSTSSDVPSLGAIYKLVEIERASAAVPIMKRSPGKQTLPGCKQAWRRFDAGVAREDLLGLAYEAAAPGTPLLEPVMRGGRRIAPPRPLRDLQAHCLQSVAALPAAIRELDPAHAYPVTLTPALQQLMR